MPSARNKGPSSGNWGSRNDTAFCTVVKGGAAACTVIAMQDGGTGTCAQHGGAGREANLIFVLPSNVYVGPPGRGDFLVSNFHPGPIPGNLVRNDFWR